MKRMARVLSALVIVGLGLPMTGCVQWGNSTRTAGEEIESLPTTQQSVRRTLRGRYLQDGEGQFQVRLPSNWEPSSDQSLNASADLRAMNRRNDIYFVAIAEPTSAVQANGLEGNAQIYRQLLISALDQGGTETPTGVTQFNGYPAVQYEIRGQVQGTPIVYLHTTVAVEDQLYQLVAWTPADQYPDNQEEMQNIILSFDAV